MSVVSSVVNTARYLWQHPLAKRDRVQPFARWVRWQLGSRLLGADAIMPFVDDTKLVVSRGMTGATGNVYAGLAEPAEMGFALHWLGPGAFFVDVGANIGAYTVLAAGAAGARVLALEPLGRAWERLVDNVRVNRLDERVRALRAAAGAERGALRMTDGLDTVNHVLAEGEGARSVQVDVITLDEACADEAAIDLLKIDVEGFELAVLQGARRLLAERRIAAVIVELNGSGERYGHADADVDRILREAGLTPCAYEPFARELTPHGAQGGSGNVIYVRDLDAARARVRASRAFRVGGASL